KIRSREASGESGQGLRPSFFQSSLPSKPDDRAMTLKKIDEIEAQMSMQWWKTKGPDSLVTSPSQHSTGGTPLSRNGAADQPLAAGDARAKQRARQYGQTEGSPLATSHEAAAMGADDTPPAHRRDWAPSKESELADAA